MKDVRAWLLRVAMSTEEAARILGVEMGASHEEISKAYKRKAIDNHPDRGGDNAKMVEINVAKDILEGKARPTYNRSSPADAPSDSSHGHTYNPPPPPKRQKEEITFSDAKSNAPVDSGVDWVFKTATAHSGYGDRSASGYVVYGKTDSRHIFIGVEHLRNSNAFTGLDQDLWSMRRYSYPIEDRLRDLAPKAIREAFSNFQWVEKSFNAKVELVEGKSFDEIPHHHGQSMAFKDMMAQIGAVGADDAWVKDRKLTVTMVLTRKYGGGESKDEIHLIINGKVHVLDDDSVVKIRDKSKVLKLVFGEYFYFSGDKKVLTKSKNGKTVLESLTKNLSSEPQSLRDLLESAASQMK